MAAPDRRASRGSGATLPACPTVVAEAGPLAPAEFGPERRVKCARWFPQRSTISDPSGGAPSPPGFLRRGRDAGAPVVGRGRPCRWSTPTRPARRDATADLNGRPRPKAAPAEVVGDPAGGARRPGTSDRDRGAATVWAAGAIAALVAVAVVLWGLGAAAVTRHRAGSAADLAALAAAGQMARGPDAACGSARWVVERMRGELESCRFDGWDALVEVSLSGGPGTASGRARAGP